MTWNGVTDNQYDPTTPSFQTETPTLEQVILTAINTSLLDLHTWLPAVVTEVVGNKVSIQPLLQVRYIVPGTNSGKTVNLAVIPNVMVLMPRGADYKIKLPVKVGDSGIALFCERSLDAWSAATDLSPVDPGDVRHHYIGDPIFIPGLYPLAQPDLDITDDLVVQNGSATLRVQKAGTFEFKNETQELIANLINLVEVLSTASTVAGGPFIGSVVSALELIQANLETLGG